MNKPISSFWALISIIAVGVLLYDYTWLQARFLEHDFETRYKIAELERPFNRMSLNLEHTVGAWLCEGGTCIEPHMIVDFDAFLKHYNVTTFVNKTEIGKGVFKNGELKYSEGDPERSYKILSLTKDRLILKNRNPKIDHPVCVYKKDHIASSL